MTDSCLLRWHRRLLAPLALLACLLVAIPGGQALAFEAPVFQGDVLDEAGILNAGDQETLGRRIRELREKDGIWAAIYITRGLQQEPIESAAVAVFEKWKLGQAGKDNGLLVLVAPGERKIRIEVGYGLEGNLTDAFSKRVIDEIYKPAFREQRYADGLMQGFDAMARAVGGGSAVEAGAPQAPEAPPPQKEIDWSRVGLWFGLAFVANLAPALLYTLAAIHGRRKGRGEARSLWEEVSTPLLVFAFLGACFGLFIGVFGATFGPEDDAMPALLFGNALFAGVFALPFAFKARRFLSESAYRRKSAGGSGNSRWEWGRSSGSSSWSDSSSSDSSSSDGGSSGGGGASGDW